MNVLFTGTLALAGGGVAFTSYLLDRGLRSLGHNVDYAMPGPLQPSQLFAADVPCRWLSVAGSKTRAWRLLTEPRQIARQLEGFGQYDLYEAHGVWDAHVHALACAARRNQRPYLVMTHGMLYPQDLHGRHALAKRLYLALRLRSDLDRAACLHATCHDEYRHLRDLGLTAPVGIVPNPVEIGQHPLRQPDGVRRIGYLGRLSPRKNVEGLLCAFAQLGPQATQGAELLVIGGGDEQYEAFLKAETARLGLQDRVRFAGFLTGRQKDDALLSLDVLAMPSEFENFGNVVAEALVRRTPCIATTGAPWQGLDERRCGWWVPYTQDDITRAVGQALAASDEQLRQMGQRGRQLMEERYAVPVVCRQLLDVYQWILGHGPRPECVHVD